MSVYFEGTADDGTHVVVRSQPWSLYVNGEFQQVVGADLYRDGGTLRMTLEDGRILYAFRGYHRAHYTEFDGKELHERNYSY